MTNWSSKNHNWKEYEELDFSMVGGEEFNRKNYMSKYFTRHNVFTVCFWLCVFIAGGLQALKGSGVGDFSTVVSILGLAEHLFAGTTS